MTANPHWVAPEASLGDATSMMKRLGIHALPVVEHDAVVGIITDRDIKMALGPESRAMDIDLIDPRQLDGSVDWFMTPDVACAHRNDDVVDAAKQMLELRVGALPLLDDANELCGILSQTDLLRHLVGLIEA
jgi:acetoin utilization protein AcuB